MFQTKWFRVRSATSALLLGFSTASLLANDNELKPPVRLEADGQPIDHGHAGGHVAPTFVDLDADNKRDLIVGDRKGQFTFYKNVGTDTAPRYESQGPLQSDGQSGEDADPRSIGSSPQFADLNGDGRLDLISGSTNPGDCYWFPGQTDGTFRCNIKDVDKTDHESWRQQLMNVTRNGFPIQVQNGSDILASSETGTERPTQGAWPFPFDWDHDGDFDLVIGDNRGAVWLRENVSQSKEFAFSETAVRIEAAGQPIHRKAQKHDIVSQAAVVVADWDVDELPDLVIGQGDGAVVWYRNVGELGQPQFEAAKTLVLAPEDHIERRYVKPGHSPFPGGFLHVAVTDWNGDGKPDLITGDISTHRTVRADLTSEEQSKFEAGYARLLTANNDLLKIREEIDREAQQVVNDVPLAEQDRVQHRKKVFLRKQELQSSKAFTTAQTEYHWAQLIIEPYLESNNTGTTIRPNAPEGIKSETHGHLWYYERR